MTETMTTQKKKNSNSSARLVIVLFLISAITALCLGLVNFITADRIAAIKAEKTAAAMSEVMPAGESFQELAGTWDNALVLHVYEAIGGGNLAGYVVEVQPSGFGGAIDMVVGVDLSGAVTGVSIIDMSETSGLGANAEKPEFRSQFVGAESALAVRKDGGTIDALTSATVTSRAVTNGVNAAIETAQGLLG